MKIYVCSYYGWYHEKYFIYKWNGSVRDYILKYLAKRKTISKKIPPDQR